MVGLKVDLKEEMNFLILLRTHREERGLKVAIKCSPNVSWNSSPANFLAPTEEIGNGGQRTTRRREKIMGYGAPTQRTPEFEWSSLCFSDVWRQRGKACAGRSVLAVADAGHRAPCDLADRGHEWHSRCFRRFSRLHPKLQLIPDQRATCGNDCSSAVDGAGRHTSS